ncbi:DUF1336 domain-containing protein [Abeliophyllum distichum]|uniref:DUF1336 domain-containing protein n=1 Tax=Abeliophyllum distichum TaxID=126358 RepID=A0ABD1SDJ8_9LAMI
MCFDPLVISFPSDAIEQEVATIENGGLLDNCGILPRNCLPFLASTFPSTEKRRSLSSSPQSARKKATLRLSFKSSEGHPAAILLSSKALLQRPIVGSQVPFCSLGKRVNDSPDDSKIDSYVDRQQQMMIAFDMKWIAHAEYEFSCRHRHHHLSPSPMHEEELDSSNNKDYLSNI